MTPRSLLLAIAAVAVSASPALAQRADRADAPSAATIQWRSTESPLNVRNAHGARRIPVTITIADSAGTLFAHFDSATGRGVYPLSLTKGNDDSLWLHADTIDGPLDIVLHYQDEGVAGYWTLGAMKGSLQGKLTG